jgi:hypothetical protein
MPTQEEILAKVRELREFSGESAPRLTQLLLEQDQEDRLLAEADKTAGFLPTLTAQQLVDLRAFLLEPNPGPPLQIEAALKEVARALKGTSQPRFWKAVFVLLKAIKQNLPHLKQEFEQ